ncbi:T7SS effector LXG polymorphic toxin, partial [Shouchella clausii]
VVSQVASWTSGGVIASPETQAEIDANMEELYQNVVTQALQMAPLDRSHIEGREGDLYQDVLPLEFLYTGAYAPLYSSLKAANWYYLNHFPVSAILSNEQALQACRAPAMGATHAVTPAYFPLFARLSTLPANATVSPAILTRQLKQLVPIQYQWYQAQLRTQAIQTAVSEVAATGRSVLTEEEVAAMQAYLENNPPGDGPLIAEVDEEVYKDGRYPGPTKDARVGADGIAYRNDIGPIIAAAADFFFGDFLTLADPEASLGEKALATTFILVKPAKVGEVVYDLSKVRKVKTGRKGNGNRVGNFTGKINADNIPNMTKNDILEGLPSNWKHTEYNGFVHIRDANGNIRMRIDPPDKVTKYDHVHIFDESGNPLDVNLNVVDRKSPDAHIPYKK